MTLTAEQRTNSVQLEPSFRHLLRTVEVHDDVILSLRVQEIKTSTNSVTLDATEDELLEKDGVGVGISEGSGHKKNVPNTHSGLDASQGAIRHKAEGGRSCQGPRRAKCHATSKLGHSHGTVSRRSTAATHRTRSCLHKTNFGAFEEWLADGHLQDESLSHLVTLAEEDQQSSSRPEPSM